MSSKFFQNKTCEYFPCHKTDDIENFNCMFCYCPLYALGKNCGGSYRYLENGVKDCSGCTLPHRRESSRMIESRFADLAELAKK